MMRERLVRHSRPRYGDSPDDKLTSRQVRYQTRGMGS